jgi:ATP-dependent RNA helicase RhlE
MKKILDFLKSASGSKSDVAATPTTPSTGFADLGLNEPLCRAVAQEGYESPTPIQTKAIPFVLQGRDLLGCAQTGTGKTAGFALPMLQRLGERPAGTRGLRALVLTPTRELAIQVADSFKTYGKHTQLRTAVIFGGVGLEPQKQELRRGPDILVATPGRLLDLMGQGCVDFQRLEIFVLDEADRMLDMGFIHDVRRVIAVLPKQRQSLLFSATMPRDIQDLAHKLLHDPVKVEVAPVSSASERVKQQVYFVDKDNKRRLLLHVLQDESVGRTLVFTRTKSGANRVAEFLNKSGIQSEAIHGNKSQSARQRALENFRTGSTRVLVASDLAARGIDVEGITHVINFEIPNVAETYVHRIGRTGRAAATGAAMSFCQADERPYLAGIEKLIRTRIPVVADHPYPPGSPGPRKDSIEAEQPRPPFQGRGGGGRRPQQSSGGPRGGRPSDGPRGPRPAASTGGGDQRARNPSGGGPRPQTSGGDGAPSPGGGKRRRRRGGRGRGPATPAGN